MSKKKEISALRKTLRLDALEAEIEKLRERAPSLKIPDSLSIGHAMQGLDDMVEPLELAGLFLYYYSQIGKLSRFKYHKEGLIQQAFSWSIITKLALESESDFAGKFGVGAIIGAGIGLEDILKGLAFMLGINFGQVGTDDDDDKDDDGRKGRQVDTYRGFAIHIVPVPPGPYHRVWYGYYEDESGPVALGPFKLKSALINAINIYLDKADRYWSLIGTYGSWNLYENAPVKGATKKWKGVWGVFTLVSEESVEHLKALIDEFMEEEEDREPEPTPSDPWIFHHTFDTECGEWHCFSHDTKENHYLILGVTGDIAGKSNIGNNWDGLHNWARSECEKLIGEPGK